MNECICCRDRLIRHLDRHRVYWFCPTCHQEMPNPTRLKIGRSRMKYGLAKSLVVR